MGIFQVGIFRVGIFQGWVWWVRIFRAGVFLTSFLLQTIHQKRKYEAHERYKNKVRKHTTFITFDRDQLLQTVDFVGAVGTRKWLIIALLLLDFTFLDHRIAVARNIASLPMCPQKINFWVTIKRMFVLTSRTDWKSCSHDESYAVKRFRFPLRISSANTTKSTGNCGFGRIYWRNP